MAVRPRLRALLVVEVRPLIVMICDQFLGREAEGCPVLPPAELIGWLRSVAPQPLHELEIRRIRTKLEEMR